MEYITQEAFTAMTVREREAFNRDWISKFVRSHSNTHGLDGIFIERRVPGDTAWNVAWPYGNDELAVKPIFNVSRPTWDFCEIFRFFNNGAAAARTVSELKQSGLDGYSWRIKRYPLPQEVADRLVETNSWKRREALRLADGTYTPLPFALEPWFRDRHEELQHFAHVSTEDPGKIAYTRGNEQGIRDIQTRVSIGKYLNEHFGDLLEDMPKVETGTDVRGEKVYVNALTWIVKQFRAQYGGETSLKFATTREAIRYVYEHGPNSCMSCTVEEYSCGNTHPTEVYAAGNLAVAYLEDAGEITARALVWPDRKLVGRCYGDSLALRHALEAEGYAKEDWYSLKGARLLMLDHGAGYVMPYIDGCGSYGAHEDGEHFKIGGPNCATYTNGLDHDPDAERCDRCGDERGDGYTVYVNRRDDEEVWCNYCFENHTFTCEATDGSYSDSVPRIEAHSGETVTRHNAEDYFQCHITLRWYHTDDWAGEFEGTGEGVSQDAVELHDLMADEDGVYWKPENFPVQAEDEVAA